MSKLAGLTGVQGGVIAGAVAVVIAGGSAWYFGAFAPAPQPEPQKVALLPQDTGEPDPATAEATPEPDPKPVAKVPEPENEPEVVAKEPAAPGVMQPEFDLVRVEPDGNATIAGRADPGAEVVIELDGQEVSRAQAGGDGSFVQFLEITPSTEPQMVRLKVEPEDGAEVFSASGAVIAPMLVEVSKAEPEATEPVKSAGQETEKPEEIAKVAEPIVQSGGADPEPVADTTEPVAPTTQQVSETKAAPAPKPAPDVEPVEVAAVEPALATPSQPQAPAVIIAGQDGVKVVQPLAPAPEVMSAVALDTISYSDQGEVQLSGRGQGSGFVRVYVDNRPVTTSRIEADGNWRSDLPDVDTGVYTLRVDEIDTEGQVVSRVETPFKREAQDVVAEAGQVKAITVQPGNTLWAIATDSYGEGNLYVRLYEANKDRIRNPDLIYPGQVFDIPDE